MIQVMFGGLTNTTSPGRVVWRICTTLALAGEEPLGRYGHKTFYTVDDNISTNTFTAVLHANTIKIYLELHLGYP